MTQLGRRASVQEEKDLNFPPRGSLKLLSLRRLLFLPSSLEDEVEEQDPQEPKFVKISFIFPFCSTDLTILNIRGKFEHHFL